MRGRERERERERKREREITRQHVREGEEQEIIGAREISLHAFQPSGFILYTRGTAYKTGKESSPMTGVYA